jgi:hypothetical protein
LDEETSMIGRSLVVLTLVAALAACGPKAPAPAGSAASAPTAAADGKNNPAPPRKDTPFPGWLTLANQAGGGIVQYQPESIKRDMATGIADVWLQIFYTEPHTFVADLKDVTQTITYVRERYLYRFDCKLARYHIMERRIMREGELVAETVPMPQRNPDDFTEIGEGGVAVVAYGPACKAVIAHP